MRAKMASLRRENITGFIGIHQCVHTKKMKSLLNFFIVHAMFWYLKSASGILCPLDQVTLVGPNSTFCWDCPSCEIGYGMSVECWRKYPVGTSIHCEPCIRGVNYSSNRGIGQCKSCINCGTYRNKTGQCDIDEDTTKCGECLSGYYVNRLHYQCVPCSWCCDDAHEHIPQCSTLYGLPKGKQCSFRRMSCAPTIPPETTSNSPSTNNMAGIIAGAVIGFLVLVVLPFVCAFILCRKSSEERQQYLHRCSSCLSRIWRRFKTSTYDAGQVPSDNISNGNGFPNPSHENNLQDSRRQSSSQYSRSVSHPGAVHKERKAIRFTAGGRKSLSVDQLKEHTIRQFRQKQYNQFENEPATSDSNSNTCTNKTNKLKFGEDEYSGMNGTRTEGHVAHQVQVQSTYRQQPNSQQVNYQSQMTGRSSSVSGSCGEELHVQDLSSNAAAQPPGTADHRTPGRTADPLTERPRIENELKNIPREKLETKTERLPRTTRDEICCSLNPKLAFFNDYRLLGQYVGLKSYEINRLQGNCTDIVLHHFETSHVGTVGGLIDILLRDNFERFDVIDVLIDWCKQ